MAYETKAKKLFAAAAFAAAAMAFAAPAAAKSAPARPEAPKKVRAKAVGERSIEASWDASKGADGYLVVVKDVSTGKKKKFRYVVKHDSGRIAARIKGLDYATKYAVRVKATAGTKTSRASDPAKTSTKVDKPAAPKPKLKSLSPGRFKIKWKKVRGADGYGVWRDVDGRRIQVADVKGTSWTNPSAEGGEWRLVVRAYRTRGVKTARSDRAFLKFDVEGKYDRYADLAGTVSVADPYSGGGDPRRVYSREQAEAFANYGGGSGSPFRSGTDGLVWINLHTYRLFAFRMENGEWRLEGSWPCIIGADSNMTRQGTYVLTRLSTYHDYGYNHAIYLTSYSGENAIHSLLYPSQSDTLDAGYKASLGCVRVVSSAAKHIYEDFQGATCVIR